MLDIRRIGIIVALVFLQLTWLVAAGASRPASQETANAAAKSPAEVARMLANQKKVVVLPGLGKKVSGKIEEDDPRYGFEHGESPVLLFQLPDYVSPYTLTVSSPCNCVGFKKSIFVPSGVFLDAEFKETRKLEEDDVKTNQGGFKKGMNVGAVFPVDEQRRSDRFLLVYTRADLLGQTADRLNVPNSGGALGALVFGGGMKVNRAAHGKLELEAVQPKK